MGHTPLQQQWQPHGGGGGTRHHGTADPCAQCPLQGTSWGISLRSHHQEERSCPLRNSFPGAGIRRCQGSQLRPLPTPPSRGPRPPGPGCSGRDEPPLQGSGLGCPATGRVRPGERDGGRLDSPAARPRELSGSRARAGRVAGTRLLQSALTELRCPGHRLPRTHVLPTTSSPRSGPVTSQSHRGAPLKRESTETASRQGAATGQEEAG